MDLQTLREQNRHDEAGALLYSYTLSCTYRKYLFMQAGTHTRKGRTLREEKIKQVLETGGKLSRSPKRFDRT